LAGKANDQKEKEKKREKKREREKKEEKKRKQTRRREEDKKKRKREMKQGGGVRPMLPRRATSQSVICGMPTTAFRRFFGRRYFAVTSEWVMA
jgi:hypothetical protein